ncbi:hypothetical protein AC1031_018186 [Aphanomyces cochlioides]|nr:hypothetical protein AC1031_018186 [Aphanomyces cochlioides]
MLCKFPKCAGSMSVASCTMCNDTSHVRCSVEYLDNFLVAPNAVAGVVCCSQPCADRFLADKVEWSLRSTPSISLSADPDMAIPENQAAEYNYEDMMREHGYVSPTNDVEEANAALEQRFRAMSSSTSGRKRSDSSFSIASSLIGREAAKWKKDKRCNECQKEFNLFLRRHHCRQCGFSFCSDHSNRRIALPSQGFKDPVRVCGDCYEWVHNSNEQLTYLCEDEHSDP